MRQDIAVQERLRPPQYGQDIIEPGEPFTDATLDTIRSLLAESDPVPEPKPISESLENLSFSKRRKRRREEAETASPAELQASTAPDRQIEAGPFPPLEAAEPEDIPVERSWRKIEVVEGRTGRSLRRFLMSPRMVSMMFLCGVVIWQPWFIPVLALLIVSSLLLVGALIGQDRMAKIVLFMLKRFVWADPFLGRVLQRVLPQRWHPVLYRPSTEDDTWDGLIDSTFEERLARIRS